MANEPDVGSLDLESETPCCIQMQGERCARHGPAVERPAPEGCAGCAALREALDAAWKALHAQCFDHEDACCRDWCPMCQDEVEARQHARNLRLALAPASPKESRRHE